jgi:hypothetical protein
MSPARKILDDKLIMLLLSHGGGCSSSQVNRIVILDTLNGCKFSTNQPQMIIKTWKECAFQHQPIVLGTISISNCDYHRQWIDLMAIVVA